MALAYNGEGPIVIRAGYTDTTCTATYNGETTVLATGTGGSRQAAIADCMTNLTTTLWGNLVAKVPILVVPTVPTYNVL